MDTSNSFPAGARKREREREREREFSSTLVQSFSSYHLAYSLSSYDEKDKSQRFHLMMRKTRVKDVIVDQGMISVMDGFRANKDKRMKSVMDDFHTNKRTQCQISIFTISRDFFSDKSTS
ncbi:hypothetical protein KP509_35G057500 [Ceratopteris richardii]|uniref:Uncharacterized protein n=1 Tax=Ceratopteris richardii TaxID=49495 RepID=A0A8T2QH18_CERRI|nr:hypothetical protein KP509_35G057500 [Ceratopteris richardii]